MKFYFPLTENTGSTCLKSASRYIGQLASTHTEWHPLSHIWQEAIEVDAPVLFISLIRALLVIQFLAQSEWLVIDSRGWSRINCWKACQCTVPRSTGPAVPHHFRGGFIATWYTVWSKLRRQHWVMPHWPLGANCVKKNTVNSCLKISVHITYCPCKLMALSNKVFHSWSFHGGCVCVCGWADFCDASALTCAHNTQERTDKH